MTYESFEKMPHTHESLVTFLSTKKPEDVNWDIETKRVIHEWIVEQLKTRNRIEITDELGEICDEAGLHDEAQRQFKNAMDLAIRAGNKIEPLYE